MKKDILNNGRLSKLLKTNLVFDCDDAFLNLTKYPNGDFCLRIKDRDGLQKSVSEMVVFVELMDIKKISLSQWANPHAANEHGIWRLRNNPFIQAWLISKFPTKRDLIKKLGAGNDTPNQPKKP